MFNGEDRTFARVPKFMPLELAVRVLERIQEYSREQGVPSFDLTLHGGEPSLWPLRDMSAFLDKVELIRAGGLRIRVGMQTNALRYDRPLLELLAQHEVKVGVSVDGPQEINDAVRVNHAGRGSYQQIMSTVDRMLQDGFEETISGFLSVAQPSVDPRDYIEWAYALPVRALDVLWPMQFNWNNLPWEGIDFARYRENPVYGRWFSELFRLWWDLDEPTFYIRDFYSTLTAIAAGDRLGVMANVHQDPPIFVVNTDGEYEYHDFVRPHADGATRTGRNVVDSSLMRLASGDEKLRRLNNLDDEIPLECSGCDFLSPCAGGFLPGRMGSSQFLAQKSVMCWDYYYYISKVAGISRAALNRPDFEPSPVRILHP